MATTTAPRTASTPLDPAFVAAFRTGTLTRELAQAVIPDDPTAFVFLLLRLSAAVAGGSVPIGPHTPSGSIPPYAKPNADPKKGRNRPGAKPGHRGTARPTPERLDHYQTHQLPVCPCCHGALRRTGRTRTRIIEDIPDDLHAEATEHTIHRDWCPTCKTQVEPVVPDALPNCTLGHRATVLSAWLHYGLGTTTSQILEVFSGHLRLPLSGGGLTEIWHRLADVLEPWYEQIHAHCLHAAVLHADETGWRKAGDLAWLWCFARDDATYYLIHPKRGHEARSVFFTAAFDGVLVTDFWKAYDVITRRRQKCWPHLLRDVTAIDGGPEAGGDWPAFSKKLWRLYGDAVRLEAGIEAMEQDAYDTRVARLRERMTGLAVHAWVNPDARRLANRLREYGRDLLTFLDVEGVPKSNNKAEREIRPAVLMRKASYGCVSDRGAATRGVLMSIYRTLRQRGLDPLHETEIALRTYVRTGRLPPLPKKSSSAG